MSKCKWTAATSWDHWGGSEGENKGWGEERRETKVSLKRKTLRGGRGGTFRRIQWTAINTERQKEETEDLGNTLSKINRCGRKWTAGFGMWWETSVVGARMSSLLCWRRSCTGHVTPTDGILEIDVTSLFHNWHWGSRNRSDTEPDRCLVPKNTKPTNMT